MFENRSQQSKTEVNARTEKSKFKSWTNLLSAKKKHVESQDSSSSRKKTHTFTIIAMNFVQAHLKPLYPATKTN